MKFYCIDRESCGFKERIPDEDLDDEDLNKIRNYDLVCPSCYGLMLAYDDARIPVFEKK